MLLAYDDDGNVIATLSHCVVYDPDTGEPLGLVDFMAHEAAGGEHADIWQVHGEIRETDHPEKPPKTWRAKGSKAWPEHLGGAAQMFKVELDGPAGGKNIEALVHRESGHRRERAALEQRVSARVAAKAGAEPANITDIVGGPDRPLLLDDSGRDRPKAKRVAKKQLPFIGRIDGPAAE